MAVIRRRPVLLGLGLLILDQSWPCRPGAVADDRTARFIELAYASALFQQRITRMVASRDIRPEVRDFAGRMASFRDSQLPRLAELARGAGITPKDTLDLELRSIANNLEPLDHLAMSRRYAEVQQEVLAAEIAGYDTAQSLPAPLGDYAREMLGPLRQLADAAQAVWNAVKP